MIDAEQVRARLRHPDHELAAAVVFGVYIVAAVPLILFHYGAYHWFFRDDWEFLAARDGRWPDLLEPHGGAHWVALPRLAYLVMWQLAGLRSYVPYQAMVVALHLTAVVLVRVIMRRAGVGPWMATAAASVLVLFGPGAENITWAFQISMVGSLVFGLAQMLLADHDGGFDRRDAAGIACGAAGLMCSGLGVSMVGAVGLAVLLRRGWKLALAHVAPLATLFVAWAAVAHPKSSTPFGRPTVSVLFRWVRTTETAVVEGIGHFPVVAGLVVAVAAVGMVLLWGPDRQGSVRDTARRLSMPLALFASSLAFAVSTGLGRWYIGDQGARVGRYVHLGAALGLPLLAVGVQAVAARWRRLTPALCLLFAIAIPFNLSGFGAYPFGKAYMDQRRYVLTTAVRMPFANRVPATVQPLPDPYSSDALNMGFLLSAERNGQLHPSTVPLTPQIINEFRVRLGVEQHPIDGFPVNCQVYRRPRMLSPAKGDEYQITGPVLISTARRGRPTGPAVLFQPVTGGRGLTIVLDGLHLRLSAPPSTKTYALCRS